DFFKTILPLQAPRSEDDMPASLIGDSWHEDVKVRYHGAVTPSAWLTPYRLAGDNHLDWSEIEVDMAESHVVSALANKRAEMAGMIARAQQQIGQFRADLAHLDATVRLFAPAMEPETIPPKRIRQSDLRFEPGGLSRRVLDALRRAGAPIRAPDLVRDVMIDNGLDPADRASFVRVQWGAVGRAAARGAAAGRRWHRLRHQHQGPALGGGAGRGHRFTAVTGALSKQCCADCRRRRRACYPAKNGRPQAPQITCVLRPSSGFARSALVNQRGLPHQGHTTHPAPAACGSTRSDEGAARPNEMRPDAMAVRVSGIVAFVPTAISIGSGIVEHSRGGQTTHRRPDWGRSPHVIAPVVSAGERSGPEGTAAGAADDGLVEVAVQTGGPADVTAPRALRPAAVAILALDLLGRGLGQKQGELARLDRGLRLVRFQLGAALHFHLVGHCTLLSVAPAAPAPDAAADRSDLTDRR